jgi:hypothetical protein
VGAQQAISGAQDRGPVAGGVGAFGHGVLR